MNRCFSLAFDMPNLTHVKVRVFGHGALLGELTLRNEERACFEALFYDDKAKAVRHRLHAGEWMGGGKDPEDRRFGHRVTEDSFVVVEPFSVCRYQQGGGVT